MSTDQPTPSRFIRNPEAWWCIGAMAYVSTLIVIVAVVLAWMIQDARESEARLLKEIHGSTLECIARLCGGLQAAQQHQNVNVTRPPTFEEMMQRQLDKPYKGTRE